MIIGVPKEIKTNENRVALTPAGAARTHAEAPPTTPLTPTGACSPSQCASSPPCPAARTFGRPVPEPAARLFLTPESADPDHYAHHLRLPLLYHHHAPVPSAGDRRTS